MSPSWGKDTDPRCSFTPALIALLVSVLGHVGLLRGVRRTGEPLLYVSITDRRENGLFSLDRKMGSGWNPGGPALRLQTVILKSLAWEVGRVVGWGSRGLGNAWPMCLCAVPSELKGEGRNPAPLLHGPLCPEGEMLELTEQRRLGSRRGGSSSHSCLCLRASHRSAVQPEPGWSSASSRLRPGLSCLAKTDRVQHHGCTLPSAGLMEQRGSLALC